MIEWLKPTIAFVVHLWFYSALFAVGLAAVGACISFLPPSAIRKIERRIWR